LARRRGNTSWEKLNIQTTRRLIKPSNTELTSYFRFPSHFQLYKNQDKDTSSEAVHRDSVGARLVRTIRKIAQVEERMKAIKTEIDSFKETELYELKTKVEAALEDGRDLLAEMADQIGQQIEDARKRMKEVGL
jgi:hypothetical protein